MTVWTPPGPLTQPAPRRVKMKASMLAYVAPFFVIAGVTVLPALLNAERETNDAKDLREHGVEAKATIDGLYTHRQRSRISYHAVYHFADPAHPGDAKYYISGDDRIEQSLYDTLKANSSVGILYDSRDPEHSAIEAELDRQPALEFQVNDIAFRLGLPALIFVGLAVYGFMKFLAEKRLLQRGQPVSATIIGETEVQGRNGRTARVAYSFKDAGGQTIQGKRGGIPTSDAKSEKSIAARACLLDNPTVLYDPGNSAKNMLYPGVFATLS